MNSKERLTLAISHKEADRVPYDLAGTTVTGISKKAFLRAMDYMGYSKQYEQKETDPIQQIVTPVEETLKLLRSDTRRIGARRIPDYENLVSRKKNILEITDIWGCTWKMDTDKDLYFNQLTYPLESFSTIGEGLSRYKVPSIDSQAEFITRDLMDQVKPILKHGVIADRNCAGLTETSLRLRGYQNWFTDTVTDPAGVEKLFDIILEYKFRYWDLLATWLKENNLEKEVDVIAECDDLGTQTSPILEPDYLRNTVISRYKALWTHIRQKLPGVSIFMHTCGSVRELLPDLIEAGMDIYNPVQFTAANMDLKGLKKDFGKDVVFWGGGINTQSTLKNGTVEVVSDEVRRILDIMAPGGGFVFTPVHNVQEDVPPENFRAMWETLMEYGKY